MLCVLMVECMSVVVNGMFVSNVCDEPTLCNLLVRTVVKLCVFALSASMVSWIVMTSTRVL